MQFAESFEECKSSFKKLVDFKAKLKSNVLSKLGNDQRMVALNNGVAEDLQSTFKKSIQKFSDLAGQQATAELLKDIGASK